MSCNHECEFTFYFILGSLVGIFVERSSLFKVELNLILIHANITEWPYPTVYNECTVKMFNNMIINATTHFDFIYSI